MKNFFAIGDIHGCFDKLLALMDKVDIDFSNDVLIFLGDYIDRGPDAYEVVEYLIQLKEQHKNVVFLKGNHEEMLENYLEGSDRLLYLVNGGQKTIESYQQHSTLSGTDLIPQEHINFIKNLDLFYQTDNYIFVHAGLRDKVLLENQGPEDLLWIRHKFIKSNYEFGKTIVFGHTPLSKPLVRQNKIGIDTGAVYGNKLTCVKLPARAFYDV